MAGISLNVRAIFNPTGALEVYQYSQILRYVANVLVSVIIARSSLSVETIGQFELLLFLVVGLSTFWSVGIKNAFMSRFSALSHNDQNNEIRSVFTWIVILSGVFSIVFWCFSEELLHFLTGNPKIPFVGLFSLILFFSVPALLTENVLYLTGQLERLVHYSRLSQGALILMVGIISLSMPSIESFACTLLIWHVIRFLYLLMRVLPLDSLIPSRSYLLSTLIFSGPLIFQSLLGQCMELTDGFLVSHFFSYSDFAVYRYGARELPFAALLFSSLSAAFIPMYVSDPDAIHQLKVKATQWMHRLFIPAMGILILSPFLFTMVYGHEFRASAQVFNLYLLILLSRVLLPQVVNFAMHQHRILLLASLLELVVNIALSLWWVRLWGLQGMIIATVVAYFMEKVVLIGYNYRVNGISPSSYIDMKWYFLYSVLFLALTWLTFVWTA